MRRLVDSFDQKGRSMVRIYPVPENLRVDEYVTRLSMRGEKEAAWSTGHALRVDSGHDRPHAYGGSEAAVLAGANGPWRIRLVLPETVRHAEVLPRRRGMVRAEGAVVEVSAAEPGYLVLNVNHEEADVPHRTVYILVDPPEEDAPRLDDSDVKALPPGEHAPEAFWPDQRRTVALLPGVHTVAGGMACLAGDMRLHLCPGAYLRSYLRADGVHGLRVTGRGVVDGTGLPARGREWRDDGWDGFVFFRRCVDCTWDGPAILDAPFWNLVTFGTRGMRIRRYKALTWKVNNDGVQPRSCRDLVVEDSFLKCNDDCIAVKTRRAAGRHSHDLVFRRLTLWNDTCGNPLEIGHTSQADVLERVRFEDIDIVHAHGGHLLSIALIDGCTVRDVRYAGIRQEGFSSACAVGFRIETSRYSTDVERGHLSDVEIDGLDFAEGRGAGRIRGFDEDHRIRDVRLRNVRVGGASLRALADLGLEIRHGDVAYTDPGPGADAG